MVEFAPERDRTTARCVTDREVVRITTDRDLSDSPIVCRLVADPGSRISPKRRNGVIIGTMPNLAVYPVKAFHIRENGDLFLS